jgi:choice-of-anchor A domain-containing protein
MRTPLGLMLGAALAITPVPAAAVTGVAADGLQAMRELNLIVLGDWTGGHDVEGKAFVGGSATGNSTTVGIGNSVQGAAPSARPTLTIVGNNGLAGINVNNGANGGSGLVATAPGVAIGGSSGGLNLNASGASLDIGGNFSGNANIGAGQTFNIGGNASGSINGTGGATVNAGGTINGNANGAAFNQNLGGGFMAPFSANLQTQRAQLEANLTALSGALAGLSLASNPSSITSLGGKAIFTAVDGGNGFALFNVDAAFFGSHSEIQYDFPLTTLPVIINVSGIGTINANLNTVGSIGGANQQLIWNFTDATTVNFNRMVHGSVLATEALVTNVTPLEGSIVARSFRQGGEVHLGTYAQDSAFLATEVLPEPQSWALLIMGFGLVGATMRRRRGLATA